MMEACSVIDREMRYEGFLFVGGKPTDGWMDGWEREVSSNARDESKFRAH